MSLTGKRVAVAVSHACGTSAVLAVNTERPSWPGGHKLTLRGGWSRAFDEPIPLPDGGELRTLLDAGRYVDALHGALT
jgi:hypothetical protein